MKPLAHIITAPLSLARRITVGQKWLITRMEARGEDIIWVPSLAPSEKLFRRYMDEWRGREADSYWPVYAKLFRQELETEEKRTALRELWKLSSEGVSVALLCYCGDPAHCHRTLIGDFLRGHGARVMEYVPQQASLF